MSLPRFALILILAAHPVLVQADGCDRASWAVEQAAQIRQLAIQHPVGCQVMGQSEYLGRLMALITRDLTPERLALEERLFKLLGFIPPSYPYARCLVESYAHQAAAYYSADTKKFVIPDWIPPDDSVLVHEATHALQDQHFDLTTLDRSPTVVSDRSLALGALVEGDAMTVEMRFLSTQGRPPAAGVDEKYRIAEQIECTLPPPLEDLFYFQYEFGSYFVARIKERYEMDEVFKAPPLTTAEIMHPQRYGESTGARSLAPLRVPDSMVHPAPAHLVYSESLGEFAIRVLLKQFISSKDAAAAATGWRADRMALYEHRLSKRFTVGWRIQMDSELAAKRMYAAVSQWLSSRFAIRAPEVDLPFWATNFTGVEIRAARVGGELNIFIAE